MSDESTRIVVNFRRQIQPKQYETSAFEMTVEQVAPATLSPEEVEKLGARLAQEVKVGVYRELNLDFEQDAETRVIMEVFKDSQVVSNVTKLPVAPVAPSAVPEPEPAPTTPAPTPRPARAPRAVPQGTDTEAAWEHLAAHPELWYDNTENKKNPKGPDFKATRQAGFTSNGYPMGLWLNTKPEDLVLPDSGYAS